MIFVPETALRGSTGIAPACYALPRRRSGTPKQLWPFVSKEIPREHLMKKVTKRILQPEPCYFWQQRSHKVKPLVTSLYSVKLRERKNGY